MCYSPYLDFTLESQKLKWPVVRVRKTFLSTALIKCRPLRTGVRKGLDYCPTYKQNLSNNKQLLNMCQNSCPSSSYDQSQISQRKHLTPTPHPFRTKHCKRSQTPHLRGWYWLKFDGSTIVTCDYYLNPSLCVFSENNRPHSTEVDTSNIDIPS